ncbi:MAG: polyprenyl synthetase family protein [Candidatus Gastranaerophilales bacterium]|nr:polyprenyl synthetase family protein [Candidatus Gastranaerophilales bacterium]MCM1072816.1 polyprenyl synthetase family protein [Bacteroides sp.]
MRELDKVLDNMKKGIEYPFLLEFLDEPSKRIRSRLAILYLKTAEKELNDEIYNILTAGELIHNASLLHDDIIDEAESRRGKTTIGVKISPKISILAGDYLIAQAMSKILEINNPDILNIFKNCTKTMCEAEFQQYFQRGQIPSKEDYISICRGKTGALFAAILESCALLAGMDSSAARILGENYGIYFQIKNDLDAVSAEEDKKNGIYTANSVLGIEKTLYLLDNLKEEMSNLLGVFPESIYKQELEGLFAL